MLGAIVIAALALIPAIVCARTAFKIWHIDRILTWIMIAMSAGSLSITLLYASIAYALYTEVDPLIYAPLSRFVFTIILIVTTALGLILWHRANIRNGNET